MQSLMGGHAMTNAPSNLGVPAGQAGQQGGSMHLTNGHVGGNQGAFGSMGAASQNGAGATSAANAQNLIYPALHLHPLNDTFAPKQISLAPPGPNNRIKIGRQTNAKTVPNPSNGYFDSKVLSRMHAEVWCEHGKVFIKDVRSSNGTFINGERLSAEAQESDVFELNSEDMVEFGIDIVGDDSKTIIHHKVACRVYLVITQEDALGLRNDFASLYRGGVHGGPLGSSGVGPGAEGGLRRGKAGFTFDHVLSKLQNELQKSKEQWSDLGSLTTTMHDIHETLGGGAAPMKDPPYQHMVPPLPAPPGSEAQARESAESSTKHAQTIAALQAQLSETQASLASHVDKIKSLEDMLSEHAQIKEEVGLIKMQMEQAKREMDEAADRNRSSFGARLSQLDDSSSSRMRDLDDDFDDSVSVASMDTVLAGDDNSRMHTLKGPSDGHVGPRAPPDLPPGVADPDSAPSSAIESDQTKATDDAGGAAGAATAASGASTATHVADSTATAGAQSSRDDELRAQNAALSARLEDLSKQLEKALALSEGLQSQHAQVTETVKVLEGRVQSLEAEVEKKVGHVEGNVVQVMEGRWTEWKQEIEAGWRREREGWETEREELRKVVQAWDEANRRMEDELNGELGGAEASRATASASSSADGLEPETGSRESSRAEGGAGGRTGERSASRGNGRSKRKRHVNGALRSLLYGSSGAGLLANGDGGNGGATGRFEHDRDFGDNDGDSSGSAGSQAGRWSDDEASTNSQTRSVADSTSTRPSTSTGITSPDISATSGDRKYGSDGDSVGGAAGMGARRSGNGRGEGDGGGKGLTHGNPTNNGAQATISAAAAGVVVVGVAAWVLAGKNGVTFTFPAATKV